MLTATIGNGVFGVDYINKQIINSNIESHIDESLILKHKLSVLVVRLLRTKFLLQLRRRDVHIPDSKEISRSPRNENI